MRNLTGILHRIRQRIARRHGEGVDFVPGLSAAARAARFAQNWPHDVATRQYAPTMGEVCSNPLRGYFDSHFTGRGIWKWNHYFDVYHEHLQKFVATDVHVAEIGVYSGGSLDMWKHYFGDQCRVWGIDIEPACRSYEDQQTRVLIGDQTDRSFWRRFKSEVPRVDVLIDDGGHEAEQQIITLEEMLPHLTPGGVYICEDIHGLRQPFAGYLYGLSASLNRTPLEPGDTLRVRASPFQASIESIHHYPFLAVIRKRPVEIDFLDAKKRGTEWQPFLDTRGNLKGAKVTSL